jgi:hypothetical protein
VQFPALPKVTLLRAGVRLSERKDMKKYLPRWPDGRRTQGLTYVERHNVFSYLATRSRIPIPTWIFPTHDLIVWGEAETSTREKKTRGKEITYLDKEVFSSS